MIWYHLQSSSKLTTSQHQTSLNHVWRRTLHTPQRRHSQTTNLLWGQLQPVCSVDLKVKEHLLSHSQNTLGTSHMLNRSDQQPESLICVCVCGVLMCVSVFVVWCVLVVCVWFCVCVCCVVSVCVCCGCVCVCWCGVWCVCVVCCVGVCLPVRAKFRCRVGVGPISTYSLYQYKKPIKCLMESPRPNH